MKRSPAWVLVAVLAAVIVASCSLGEEDPTYPLPSAPITWPLPTQPASSPSACPTTELAPVQVDWDAVHRTLSLGGQKVFFPAGFTSRELPSGRLEIVAPDGSVIARDGDTLNLGGSDYMHVCRVQSVEY
jgi:hypothetical protein